MQNANATTTEPYYDNFFLKNRTPHQWRIQGGTGAMAPPSLAVFTRFCFKDFNL